MIRTARADEVERLTGIWHAAWHEAHAAHVPPGLVAVRTKERFATRLETMVEQGVVLVVDDPAIGFVATDGLELYQLMLSQSARGTGAASALVSAACERIAMDGFARAWLHCAVGNIRARRFYEREGWAVAFEETVPLGSEDETFEVACWRMERAL